MHVFVSFFRNWTPLIIEPTFPQCCLFCLWNSLRGLTVIFCHILSYFVIFWFPTPGELGNLVLQFRCKPLGGKVVKTLIAFPLIALADRIRVVTYYLIPWLLELLDMPLYTRGPGGGLGTEPLTTIFLFHFLLYELKCLVNIQMYGPIFTNADAFCKSRHIFVC